jgi:hypothetical protein
MKVWGLFLDRHPFATSPSQSKAKRELHSGLLTNEFYGEMDMTSKLLTMLSLAVIFALPISVEAKTPMLDSFVKTKVTYVKTCIAKSPTLNYCGNYKVKK